MTECTCYYPFTKFNLNVGPGFRKGERYKFSAEKLSYKVWHNEMYYTILTISQFNDHFVKDAA